MAFPLLGNSLWIDLVNTEPASPDGGRLDLLDSARAAAAWARAVGLLSANGASKLDDGFLARIHGLRSQLRSGAEAILAGREPPPQVIKAVNAVLMTNPSVTLLERGQVGWCLTERPAGEGIDVALARLALDFAGMLADGRGRLLRRCERHDCVMMFLDTSKNHSRRWCSMESCGNREKAAARRARVRAVGG